MHRYHLFILIAFSLLVAEGCRRGGSSVRQPPIKVNSEKEFRFGGVDDKELLSKAKPKKAEDDSQIDPDVLNPDLPKAGLAVWNAVPEEKWKWPEGSLDPNVNPQFRQAKQDDPQDTKWIEFAKKKFDAAREKKAEEIRKKEMERRTEDLVELSMVYYEFCKSMPAKDRTFDRFLTHTRRSQKTRPKEAERHLRLYTDMKSNAISVHLDADKDFPTHVVGFYVAAEKKEGNLQVHVATEQKVGNAIVVVPGKAGGVKTPEDTVRKQRLSVILYRYKDYLDKTKPEERKHDALVKHFKANAPAVTMEAIENQTIYLADVTKPSAAVACYADLEKDKETVKGHWAIFNNGSFNYISPAIVAASFVTKGPEKKGGMGDKGGMPPPMPMK
jgi:hypothetical protein